MIKKLILFLLAFTSTTGFLMAQKIQQAEYFIDIDPGIGKATPISFTESDTLVEREIEYDVSGLDVGPHLLICRVMDENGTWSLAKSTRFYIDEGNTGSAKTGKIVQAEYFIDDDPGMGNGTSLNFDNSADTLSKQFDISVDGLSPGVHYLVCRTKDDFGNWGVAKAIRFFIEEDYTPEADTLFEIEAIEFFLGDTDPGNGLANSVVVQNIGDEFFGMDSVDLSLSGISTGRHYILSRVKDKRGLWSLTVPTPFDYCTGEGLTANYGYSRIENTLTLTDSSINAVDYIWDMDNGDSLYAQEPIYTYNMGGVYKVCQTVYSFCDTSTFCRTILVPTPRVKDSLPDIQFIEDDPKLIMTNDLNEVFEDLDGDPLSFDVVSDHKYLVALIENEIGLSIQPTNDLYGEYEVIVSAEGGGVKAYDTIQVKITSVNDTPRIVEPIGSLIYDEDSGPRLITSDMRKIIKDPDDSRLEYLFTSDTAAIIAHITNIFDDSARWIRDELELSFEEDFHGVVNMEITATDKKGLSITDQFKVTILSLDDAPRLLKNIPNYNFNEDVGTVVLIDDLEEYFYEPEGDQIIYSFVQNEDEVNVYENEGKMLLQTVLDFNGESEVVVEASSTTLVTRDTFKINLNPRNDAPRFYNLDQLATCPEINFQLDLSSYSTDVDGADSDIVYSSRIVGIDNEKVSNSDLDHFINGSNLILFSKTKEAVVFDLQIGGKDGQQAVGYDTVQVKVLGASFTQSNDTLYASEGNEYQWYLDGSKIEGANNSFFKGGGGGAFQVEITHDSCTVLSEGGGITGLPKHHSFHDFTIYPNPNNGLVNIQFYNNVLGMGTVKIYTQFGKLVFVESFEKSKERFEKQLNVSDLPNGFYFFEILFGDKRGVQKLIKE
ncbi:T9SS type A sorting domain-containing protein [Flexithrix dorotheae]|uniref:T9SS type A sorting domain-containing protein n=1 Tax=Flexithrix dorotheae TaxID=70993 RepID=UPI0003A88DB1|nr:T9SS type A sorting domain-containing protein [Flexithrix dorotheae]